MTGPELRRGMAIHRVTIAHLALVLSVKHDLVRKLRRDGDYPAYKHLRIPDALQEASRQRLFLGSCSRCAGRRPLTCGWCSQTGVDPACRIADLAAGALRRRGWRVGELRDPILRHTSPLSLLEALESGGWLSGLSGTDREEVALRHVLSVTPPIRFACHKSGLLAQVRQSLREWNDEPGRTAADVLTVLSRASSVRPAPGLPKVPALSAGIPTEDGSRIAT